MLTVEQSQANVIDKAGNHWRVEAKHMACLLELNAHMPRDPCYGQGLTLSRSLDFKLPQKVHHTHTHIHTPEQPPTGWAGPSRAALQPINPTNPKYGSASPEQPPAR
eukprot:1152809-Pelagomonas_calceolata.AAC.5